MCHSCKVRDDSTEYEVHNYENYDKHQSVKSQLFNKRILLDFLHFILLNYLYIEGFSISSIFSSFPVSLDLIRVSAVTAATYPSHALGPSSVPF